jgi:hypothetical protein
VVERRVELQIRSVLVSYRIEQRRTNSDVMREFRRRAEEIFAALEEHAEGHPDLLAQIAEARRELRAPDGGKEPTG